MESSPVYEESCCTCTQVNNATDPSLHLKIYLPAIISFVMLIAGIAMDYFNPDFFKNYIRIAWFVLAYIPVGLPVLKDAWDNIAKGEFFTEFFLMGIATVGAFALGHYHEGVAVMLFYAVGELLQHSAVNRSKENIKALLDVRPNSALVFRDNIFVPVHPQEVAVGEKIQVRTGEKIPLDGKLLSSRASLNKAAITGESKPDTVEKGENVYAGSINLEAVIEIQTTKLYEDSSISRILQMVEHAISRKSRTELFIRKFARVYTPIVVFSAIALTLLPYFFVSDYVFGDWLYRALIFLVVSCPCALVISIPLGYFGGLGAASKNGILFKGASFLDAITKINTVVLDKTGTLTKGVFKIKRIVTINIDEAEMMAYLQAIEAQSTHPIARAILEYENEFVVTASNVKEIAGKGLTGTISDKTVLVGNKLMMKSKGIEIPSETQEIVESVVMIAIDGQFMGYAIISDELKDDAFQAIQDIKKLGIKNIIMLSGDKPSITERIGQELGLKKAKGGLLPEEKLKEVESLKKISGNKVAFVGDGINDAPVIAASDVGIAMGGLGSDMAIETADVVIQTDHPSKIARAIKIGRSTRHIVWQNISLAFGVKLIVLIMGAGGIATMWEAVFADVGVAFLAILNAIRLQGMKWK